MKTPTSEPPARERLSAWQRWELASLSDPAPATVAGGPAAANGSAAAAEHAQLRAAAVAEGRTAGHAEGLAQAQAERERLAKLLGALSNVVADHEQRMADEVLDLALVLARQIVGEALSVRRDLLLPVVSAALRQLPQSTQRVELVVHPADREFVAQMLGQEPLGPRCQIVASTAMAPGGCRLETEQCEVDATIASRWKRLLAAMGRSDDWLEPA